MAYDDGAAQRVRELLAERQNIEEKKMFGGIAFMLSGNMCCGIIRDMLMARVGPEQYAAALAEPHAHEMDFTGKPLTGFIYIDAEGFAEDEDLQAWVGRCLDFAGSLPPK